MISRWIKRVFEVACVVVMMLIFYVVVFEVLALLLSNSKILRVPVYMFKGEL
jgi:hypothetical protein